MITKVIFNYYNANFMLERHQNWIQVNQKHLHTTEYLSKVSDATFIYSFSTVTECTGKWDITGSERYIYVAFKNRST